MSLFPHCEQSFFTSIYRRWVPLVSATPLTVLYGLFRNFACVFFMVWECACGLGTIVRIFLSLVHNVNLVMFYPQYIDNGYLLWAQLFLQFCTDHFEVLHMFFLYTAWCAYGLGIIVRTFLSLFPHCELSHFSPLVYRQWVSLVSATPLTVLCRLFWNVAYVVFMVWGCACGLHKIVRSFLSLFPHYKLSHFSPFIYK